MLYFGYYCHEYDHSWICEQCVELRKLDGSVKLCLCHGNNTSAVWASRSEAMFNSLTIIKSSIAANIPVYLSKRWLQSRNALCSFPILWEPYFHRICVVFNLPLTPVTYNTELLCDKNTTELSHNRNLGGINETCEILDKETNQWSMLDRTFIHIYSIHRGGVWWGVG